MLDWARRASSVIGICAALSACGGDAFVGEEGSGGSGNGGSGGSSGSGGSGASAGSSNGGTSGSSNGGDAGSTAGGTSNGGTSGGGNGGTGGNRECPDNRPMGECESPGLECHYGDSMCCQDRFTCVDGRWVETPCPMVGCPLVPPAHGSDCACLEGKQCTYGCGTDIVATEASCTASGTWAIQSRPCPGPCGNATCMLGQVCVTKLKQGMVDAQYCTPTTCSGELTCQCAGALCGVGYACTEVQNLGLVCTAT